MPRRSGNAGEPPWASGPKEILKHGLVLLGEDTDANRRLAMLSIDNAVELIAKTFLSLPQRVTGFTIGRKKLSEIEYFPELLDALERYAPERLQSVNLAWVEWFHRMRNDLYHNGNGVTVEREKVEMYAQFARLLLRNLLSVEIDDEALQGGDLLSKFLAAWAELEEALWDILGVEEWDREDLGETDILTAINSMAATASGIKSKQIVRELLNLRTIRNSIVRGESDHRKVLKLSMLSTLQRALMLARGQSRRGG